MQLDMPLAVHTDGTRQGLSGTSPRIWNIRTAPTAPMPSTSIPTQITSLILLGCNSSICSLTKVIKFVIFSALLIYIKSGTGGGSSLVDGFYAAGTLHATSARDYAQLARTKLFYHASGNAGLSIQGQTAFPVLVHDEITNMLTQIRWNTADKAAFAVDLEAQPVELDNWYKAAR